MGINCCGCNSSNDEEDDHMKFGCFGRCVKSHIVLECNRIWHIVEDRIFNLFESSLCAKMKERTSLAGL